MLAEIVSLADLGTSVAHEPEVHPMRQLIIKLRERFGALGNSGFPHSASFPWRRPEPPPGARTAFLPTRESLASRELVAEVPLTGLSLMVLSAGKDAAVCVGPRECG